MKATLSDLRDVLVDPSEGSDRHFYGTVTRKNTNAAGAVKSYEVSLGGAEGTMTCRKLAGADVGDTVMVTLTKTGMAVVTGTVDGDKDAADAQETANTAQETAEAAAEDIAAVEELVGDGDTSGITVTTYYYLSSSNVEPLDGTWSEDMPAYTVGMYYWKKTVTTYADGSEVESDPILDSMAQLSAEADYLLASVNNHFWVDENGGTGAYVSENDQDYSTGYALRMASSGIAQMYNGNPMNTLTSSGLTFYQNNGSTPMAQYSSAGVNLYSSGTLMAQFVSSGVLMYANNEVAAQFGAGSVSLGTGTKHLDIDNGQILFYASRIGQSPADLRATIGLDGTYNRLNIDSGGTIRITSSGTTTIDATSLNVACNTSVTGTISATGNISSSSAITATGNMTANKMYLVNPTTGSSTTANVRLITASTPYEIGFLSSGSSRTLKHDIKPIELDELDPHRLYDADVIQFIYNKDYLGNEKDCRYDRPVPGFIAEDLYEVYPVAVDVEDGKPQTWNERYILPPMLALIQEQKKEIDILTERVNELWRMQNGRN